MFRKSLVFRVVAMNVVLLTVGIGMFTAFHFKRDHENMIAMTTNGAKILMSTIESVIFNSKCTGDPQRLHKALKFIAHNPSLLGIRIFDPRDGRVVNSSISAEINHSVSPHTLSLYSNGEDAGLLKENGEEVLSVMRPIRTRPLCQECHGKQKQVLGVLCITYSMRETMQKLEISSRCFLLSMIFIILALSAGIALILMRQVCAPIQLIARRMAEVEDGDLTVRLQPKHNDEIAYMMQRFNSMVENLALARKELQELHFKQMERADRLASIGEMATGMAHEIKNPLAGMSGAINVLADDFSPDDPRHQVVQDVLAQIDRLNKTATDLLNFGRPGSPQRDYLDINTVVKETLFFVAQHPESKGVEQVLDFGDNLPAVWADRKQLQQVVLNVIINALQAMDGNGVLTVRTMTCNIVSEVTRVCVKISDSGAGIAPEMLDKIFTPFYTTKNRGTGLGLAICKQLMDQNDGGIRVESTPGAGACFTIFLPACAMPQ